MVETKNGEHVFRFKVRLEEKNEFQIKSGSLADSPVIYKCAKSRLEYKVVKGKSQNWV